MLGAAKCFGVRDRSSWFLLNVNSKNDSAEVSKYTIRAYVFAAALALDRSCLVPQFPTDFRLRERWFRIIHWTRERLHPANEQFSRWNIRQSPSVGSGETIQAICRMRAKQDPSRIRDRLITDKSLAISNRWDLHTDLWTWVPRDKIKRECRPSQFASEWVSTFPWTCEMGLEIRNKRAFIKNNIKTKSHIWLEFD